TGRWVGFGGGPQTAMSGSGFGRELYGIEATPGWQQYADYVGYTGPTRTPIGPSGPGGGAPDTTPLGWQQTVAAGPGRHGLGPAREGAAGRHPRARGARAAEEGELVPVAVPGRAG